MRGLNMKSVETSEGCGRQGRRRERVKAQQDNSQVPPFLKDPGTNKYQDTSLDQKLLKPSLTTLRYFF